MGGGGVSITRRACTVGEPSSEEGVCVRGECFYLCVPVCVCVRACACARRLID